VKRFSIVALTGRSGSGKSFAADYLKQLGVQVIDGDDVARQVVRKGSKCLKELVKAFSEDILNDNGTLNRKKLADICFADKAKKRKLDKITHPYIIERMVVLFDDLKSEGHRYCVVEAGAVVESGLYTVCDKMIMITADEDRQIERIVERDNITEQQARARLAAQLDADEVEGLCDVVIANDGTIEEFKVKIENLAKKLNEWFEKQG